jgi:MFS family permease
MIATLRQRSFGFLWLAGLISVIGDWLIIVALPFYIYEQTGSPLAVGGLFVAYYAPRILVSPLAGLIVDRLDRKQIMVVSDLARVPLLLALLAVHSPAQLWILYLAIFVEASLGQFFLPAKGALVPQLVEDAQLTAANALNALNTNLGRLLGSAAAGVVLATWGLAGIALIDAASYGISALLIAGVAVRRAPQPGAERLTTTLREDLRAALEIVRRQRVVRGLFIVFGVVNFADSITALLFVVFVQDILGVGAPELGWLLAAGAAGGITRRGRRGAAQPGDGARAPDCTGRGGRGCVLSADVSRAHAGCGSGAPGAARAAPALHERERRDAAATAGYRCLPRACACRVLRACWPALCAGAGRGEPAQHAARHYRLARQRHSALPDRRGARSAATPLSLTATHARSARSRR